MRKIVVLLFGVSLISIFIILQNHSIRVFVAAVQTETEASTQLEQLPIGTNDMQELRNFIQREAVKRSIAPIDAKVDPVWKAIPAYNGLEVDIERTLRLARDKPKAVPITYMMKEISPAIHLEDLGSYPIYKGNPQKPMVSIMINVAWGNEFISDILDTLEKEKVHATFFFDGTWLNKNMETARLIQSKGHELSNHAYSHKNMSKLSREEAIEELVKTQDLLKALGVSNTLFAPPSGDFDRDTVRIAYELGLKTILWTLDTVDWRNPGSSRILQRISTRVEPGSLILMHPTRSSSEALSEMIHTIKHKGLALGTVSELISPKRIVEPVQTGN